MTVSVGDKELKKIEGYIIFTLNSNVLFQVEEISYNHVAKINRRTRSHS